MLKINYRSLFIFTFLFLNNSNVLCSSFREPEQSSFPSIPESSVSVPSSFPISSSVTPQPYQWHFNNSTDTFIPPLMLSGWSPNNSTDIFNTNHFSLPIMHDIGNFNYAFVSSNNTPPFIIPDDSIPDNTTPSVVSHTQEQEISQMNQDKDHAPAKKRKKKPKKKPKRAKKNYLCPTCNKKLANRTSFNYHLKTHDPNRPRPYQCNNCHKSFAEKHILKNHVKRHNDEKPFKCDYCSKHFRVKYERTRHHRTHTGEKLFKCPICQKGLSSKSTLENHLNKHLGKKPYQCQECQKSFRHKSNLREHSKLHKDKKPYKCDQCTKAYASHSGLKNHIKVHKPKPYSCQYCEAAFIHKSKYDNHIRYEESTDGDRKCHICKKVYSDKRHLARHNKKVHLTNL